MSFSSESERPLSYRETPASLADYCEEGRWLPYDHLLLLDRALFDVARGAIKRLMVEMPPRHGKSELTSKFFPAWFLGNFPDKKIILTSYAYNFAAEWGAKARDVMAEFGEEIFGLRLHKKYRSADNWGIEGHRGRMMTAGVRGPLTGKGGHILIIDDPVKNNEEALSETYRQKTHDWYKSTFRTRAQKDGAIILIMTRWHEDDLAGRLLEEEKKGGEKWHLLKLKAISDVQEDMGVFQRGVGQPLCDDLIPMHELEAHRIAMGPYWWGSLYQQEPSPEGGGIIQREWLRHWNYKGDRIDLDGYAVPWRNLARFATVDLAAKEKEKNDWTVICVWGISGRQPRDLVLLDVFRERIGADRYVPEMQKLREKWRPSSFVFNEVGLGLAVVDMIRACGIPTTSIPVDGDKMARLLPAQPLYAAGRVWHPHESICSCLHECEKELLGFPNQAHDDFVDNVSTAANKMPQTKGLLERLRRLGATDEDKDVGAGIQMPDREPERPEGY